MSKTLPFAKMHGAGNDFVVLTGTPPSPPRDAALVVELCHRRLGIGADGLLFMERSPAGSATHFRMHFYNQDGGRVNLCLNGSRCVARRAVELGWAESTVRFETERAALSAEVDADGVTLQLTELPSAAVRVALPAGSPAAEGWAVDTGDPHLVVEVDAAGLAAADFEARARVLRYWTAQFPTGTNVHFLRRGSPDRWAIRSFERGVEAETLACGSGCVAAVRAFGSGVPVALRTATGDRLTIDPTAPLWTLRGPAVTVCEGEVHLQSGSA